VVTAPTGDDQPRVTPVIGGIDALSLATYRAANATLIQTQASIPLAQA